MLQIKEQVTLRRTQFQIQVFVKSKANGLFAQIRHNKYRTRKFDKQNLNQKGK